MLKAVNISEADNEDSFLYSFPIDLLGDKDEILGEYSSPV